MNEKLLRQAFDMLKESGYEGEFEDYKKDIQENEEIFNISKKLVGFEEENVGKLNDVAGQSASATSIKNSTPLEIEGSDLVLVNGFLEQQTKDPDGNVQSMFDQYQTRTKNDPSNYNIDNKVGQFLLDKIASFGSGTFSILGGAADAIEMVGDVASTKGIDIYNYFADDENDFTQQERNIIAGNIEKAFVLDDLFQIGAAATSKLMTKRDAADGEGITGAIKEGNYLEALDRTLSGMFQAAPSVVAAIAPGGLALIGASSVGQHYEEKTNNNAEDRGLGAMLGSLAQGTIELGSEMVTRGLFKGVNRMLPGAAGRTMSKTIATRVLGGMFSEGTSEVASEEINNAIDLIWDIDKFHDKDGNFDGKMVLNRVMDTGIISSLIGGVTTGGVELSNLGKAVQADRLLSPSAKNQINLLNQSIKTKKAENVGIENKQTQNEIIQLEAKIKKIHSNNRIVVDKLNKEEKLEMLRLLGENTMSQGELNNLNLTDAQKQNLQSQIKNNNDSFNKIYTNKVNEIVKERKIKQVDILNSSKILGIDLIKTELNQTEYDARVKKELIDQVNKDKSITDDKIKKSKIDEINKEEKLEGAFITPDGEVVINEQAFQNIEELGDVGLSSKSHELLHPILDKLIGDVNKQAELVEQFKKQLNNNQRVIMDGLLKDRGYTEEEVGSEYFTVFSDAILNGDITYEENFGTTIKNFWENLVKAILPNKLKEVGFKDGKQAYEFIKEYNNSVKKGEFSDAIIRATTEEEKTKTKAKKSRSSKSEIKKAYEELQQIDETESNFTQQPEIRETQEKRKKELLKIVQDENAYEELRQIDEFEADFNPTEASKNRKKELLDLINKEEKQDIIRFSKNEKASAEVQRLFNEKPRDWENLVIEQMRPITAKLVERRRDVTGFDREELLRDFEVGERGIFDLIRSYDPSKNDSLAAYINTFLSFRAQESSKRILKPVFESDVTEEKGVAAQEDDLSIEDAIDESFKPTVEEKSKLRRQIKLPDEQVEKVRQAVRKTFGTKLPALNSPEFKKALRKAYDTELFKDLKTNVFKTRDEYRNFLRENWKALYDAIPQETLNQSFATFREPVLDENGKQKREKTPEGERIFRKKNITREEFLDYFFNPKVGGSTRGTRKDAIVRMLAQELGFDATMETIQEPKVAEKIAFANPSVKVPELSDKVNRKQDLRFARIPITEKLSIENFDKFDELNENKKYNKIISINREEFLIDEKTGKKITKGKGNELIKEKVVKDLIAPKFLNDELSPELRDYLIYSLTGIGKQKIPQGLTSGLPFGRGGYLYPNVVSAKKALGLEKKVLDKLKESPEYQKAFKLAGTKAQTTSKIPKSVVTKLKTDKKLQQEVLEENEYKKTTLKDILKGFSKVAQKYPGLSDHVNHLIGLQSYYQGHFIRRLIPFVSFTDPSIRKNFKGHDEHFSKALETAKFAQYMIDRAATDPDYLKSGKFDTDYDLLWKGAARGLITQQAGKRIDAKGKKTGKRTTISESPLIELKNSLTDAEAKNHFLLPNTQFNPSDEIVSIDNIRFAKSKKKKVVKEVTTVTQKEKKNKTLNKGINQIIEDTTGIQAKETIGEVRAGILGEKNKKSSFFIPSSAEDFMGLMYSLIGKGKKGEQQKKWIQENITKPYAAAMEKVTTARNILTGSFTELKKELGIVPKDLKKKIPNDIFTQEQAVRVYMWNKQGIKIPGISESEVKNLVKYIESKPNLVKFANNIIRLNGEKFTTPNASWPVSNIGNDLLESLNTNRRAGFLEEWQNNVDVIFSPDNLNKMEAAFGKPYRQAVENSLQRQKTGRNRTAGKDHVANRVIDWLTGSIGAIMFFNTRSAVLQTISAINFINFGDNNVFAAGKAFANQPQFWSDFKMLFNSEFLLDRRDGLRMNVNEADIADIAKEQGARGVVNKLLKLGFAPTQLADSFAIASGGSTFYRNRYNSLIKQGLSESDANTQAMRDFRETAEESQQSSRPDKISQQQAGELGRVILAFANTPSQYARIIKKAALDLKNRRGNDKENISKIVYYSAAQNFIFNALQQALFAISFDDEEEEKTKKQIRVANGMVDSLLRGSGVQGAIASVVKNAALRIYQESEKDRPKYSKGAIELLKISPPLSSKFSRLESAGKIMEYEGDEIIEKGLTFDNPAVEISGKTISAITNIPLDRVVKKIDNLKTSTQNDLDFYQRLALIGGWSKWDLGLEKTKTKNRYSKRTYSKRTYSKRDK